MVGGDVSEVCWRRFLLLENLVRDKTIRNRTVHKMSWHDSLLVLLEHEHLACEKKFSSHKVEDSTESFVSSRRDLDEGVTFFLCLLLMSTEEVIVSLVVLADLISNECLVCFDRAFEGICTLEEELFLRVFGDWTVRVLYGSKHCGFGNVCVTVEHWNVVRAGGVGCNHEVK